MVDIATEHKAAVKRAGDVDDVVFPCERIESPSVSEKTMHQKDFALIVIENYHHGGAALSAHLYLSAPSKTSHDLAPDHFSLWMKKIEKEQILRLLTIWPSYFL